MSIQSNINGLIGQSAVLMALSPTIQQAGENVRDEQRLGKIEKSMTELKSRGARLLSEEQCGTADDKAYTELMKEHRDIDLKRIKRGGPMHHYFKGASPLDRLALTYPDLFTQRAEKANADAKDSMVSKAPPFVYYNAYNQKQTYNKEDDDGRNR